MLEKWKKERQQVMQQNLDAERRVRKVKKSYQDSAVVYIVL